MNRRNFLMTAGALSFATAADAQSSGAPDDSSTLAQLYQTPVQIDVIAQGVITLNYILTVVFQNAESLPQSVSMLLPYLRQLFVEDAHRTDFTNGIQRFDFSNVSPEIEFAAERAHQLLIKAGTPEEINTNLIRDFSRASKILAVRTSDNRRWWCKCYGLKILC